MVRLLFLLICLSSAMAIAACGDDDVAPLDITPPADESLPAVRIVGSNGQEAEVRVELASTPEERAYGLMFREELADHRGMLFVFPEDHRGGFWMKNTFIPLDIAFIDSGGTVIEVHAREPHDEQGRGPARPYRYALEVNQGWFERNGLGAGDRVELPEGLSADR